MGVPVDASVANPGSSEIGGRADDSSQPNARGSEDPLVNSDPWANATQESRSTQENRPNTQADRSATVSDRKVKVWSEGASAWKNVSAKFIELQQSSGFPAIPSTFREFCGEK